MGWLDANEYLLIELAARERIVDAGDVDATPVTEARESPAPETTEPGYVVRAPRISRCPGAVPRWT